MNLLLAAFFILLAIAIVIITPMITIWAVNLLFSLQIPLNLATWFATLWLSFLIGGPRVRYKS